MVFPCPLAMLSGALVLGMVSVPAQARTNDLHSERLPGSARSLTVALKDGNFSIQTKAPPPSTAGVRKIIRLGNSLTFDRQLFEHTSFTQLEIKNAAQH